MKSKLFIQLLAIVLMVAMLLPTLASCVTITEPEETTDTEVETTTQKTVESTTPQSLAVTVVHCLHCSE